MSEIVGGLRTRLVADSLRLRLIDGLAALGWFDAGRQHAPVTFLVRPQPWNEPVAVNTLVLAVDQAEVVPWELGSELTEETLHVVINLYAENDTIGLELSNDLRDLLRGRLPAIGHGRSTFSLLDLRQATPVAVGYATVEGVVVNRSAALRERQWLRHWFTIAGTVVSALAGDGL